MYKFINRSISKNLLETELVDSKLADYNFVALQFPMNRLQVRAVYAIYDFNINYYDSYNDFLKLVTS